MLLTIDIGNTNTVLGLYDGESLAHSWRVKTDARSTSDEMHALYRALLADAPNVTGISACSTVPAVLRELRLMTSTYWSEVPCVIVEPGVRTGVSIVTDNPKEVGSDRIVNTLAAFHQFGGPCIVVDFGTSTNIDVISAKGEFIGGALAPGVEISLDALAARAAQLRKVELTRPRAAIGKNTVEALQSGALFGFAGQVDGLVTRIIAELGGSVTAVVATGGLASLIVPESATISDHEPNLTLNGLRLLFDRVHAA